MRDILTLRDLAHELRVSRSFVNSIRGGKHPELPPIPVIRLGRRIILRRAALEGWLLLMERSSVEDGYASGLFARSITERRHENRHAA